MNFFANLARGLFGEIDEPYKPFDPNAYEHMEGTRWKNSVTNDIFIFMGVLCTSEDYYWVLHRIEPVSNPTRVDFLPVSLNIEKYGYEQLL